MAHAYAGDVHWTATPDNWAVLDSLEGPVATLGAGCYWCACVVVARPLPACPPVCVEKTPNPVHTAHVSGFGGGTGSAPAFR